MSDLLVRNVPKKTLESLRARARRHGRSVQAEVLQLLERARLPAGDLLLVWLNNTKERGISSQPGIDAIRQTRDER